jgi:hypothetical protein
MEPSTSGLPNCVTARQGEPPVRANDGGHNRPSCRPHGRAAQTFWVRQRGLLILGPKKKPRQNRGGTSMSVRGGKAFLLVAQSYTVVLRFAQAKSSHPLACPDLREKTLCGLRLPVP